MFRIRGCAPLNPSVWLAIIIAIVVACTSHAAPADRTDTPVIHIERHGHGRPLVLIPGLSCSGEVFDGAVARYATAWECHVVTLGGFAGQPKYDGPFLDGARDALLAYLDARHLDHPVIVGHSLGGVLALQVAIARPDALGGVVILDALPFLGGAGDPTATESSARTTMKPFCDMIRNETREQYEAFERTSPYVAALVSGEADRKRVTAWGLASDPRAVADAMFEVNTIDLRPQLARVHVPLLVLGSWYGMRAFTTAQRVDSLYHAQFAGVPQMQFALADTARHFLMLDDPVWTWGRVEAFLAALPRGRRGAR